MDQPSIILWVPQEGLSAGLGSQQGLSNILGEKVREGGRSLPRVEEGYSCNSLLEEDEPLSAKINLWSLGRPADLWDEPPNLTAIVPSPGV